MKNEEELEPRDSGDKPKKKTPKKKRHLHIGPYARAYRAGLAFCPSCDAEKIIRLTSAERDAEQAAKEAQRAGRK